MLYISILGALGLEKQEQVTYRRHSQENRQNSIAKKADR